nr:hypothetical protein [Tanacetum cinerariifolium]
MGQDRQMQMVGGQNAGTPAGNQVIQNAVQNPRVQNVGNQNGLIGVQGNGNQNGVIGVQGNGNQNGVIGVQGNGNQNGLIGVQGNGNQNQIRNGNLVATRAKRNAAGQNGNQIRCYNCMGKEETGIQLQVEEYDLMLLQRIWMKLRKSMQTAF